MGGEKLNYVSPESKENRPQSCNNIQINQKNKEVSDATACIELNKQEQESTTSPKVETWKTENASTRSGGVTEYPNNNHEIEDKTGTPPTYQKGPYTNAVSRKGSHAPSTDADEKMDNTSSPTAIVTVNTEKQNPDSATYQTSYHTDNTTHYNRSSSNLSSNWNDNGTTHQGNGGTVGSNQRGCCGPAPSSGRVPPIPHSVPSTGVVPPSYYDYSSRQPHHVPTQYPNETLSSVAPHESSGPPPMIVSYPTSSSSGSHPPPPPHDYHSHPPQPPSHPVTTTYGAPPPPPPPPTYHHHHPPSTVVYANGAYYHHYMVPPPPPIEYIRTIKSNDVLCGRGGATNSHSGNRSFRVLVKKYQDRYLKAKKRDKPSVASMVVDLIREKGGRFLRRSDSLPGGSGDILWVDIGDERAREKTCQALREGAPERRRNGNSIGGNKNSSDEDEVKDEKRKSVMTDMSDETEETTSNSSSNGETPRRNPILGTTVAIRKSSTTEDSTRFRDSYLMREEVYSHGSEDRMDFAEKEGDFMLHPLTRFTKPSMSEMGPTSDLTLAEKEMYLRDFLPPIPSLRTTSRKRKHVRLTHEDSYHTTDHHSVDPEHWGQVASV